MSAGDECGKLNLCQEGSCNGEFEFILIHPRRALTALLFSISVMCERVQENEIAAAVPQQRLLFAMFRPRGDSSGRQLG